MPDFAAAGVCLTKSPGSSGFFFFGLGFFLELFCPGRILDAADAGDQGDQTSEKEDGRYATEDKFIEGTPPDDNEPDARSHGDQASDNGQEFTHESTSTFFAADYNKTHFPRQHIF